VGLLGRYAGQAPGNYRVVSGVEYFDLTGGDGGGDDVAVVPSVGAIAQEDADVGATFGAKRLGFLAGVLVVNAIEFGFVQYGVADRGSSSLAIAGPRLCLLGQGRRVGWSGPAG
jgi:hypothetical protein